MIQFGLKEISLLFCIEYVIEKVLHLLSIGLKFLNLTAQSCTDPVVKVVTKRGYIFRFYSQLLYTYQP